MLKNLLQYFYLFLIFFPYLTVYSLGTDMQPWTLLFGMFILISKFSFVLSRCDFALGVVFLCSVMLIAVGDVSFTTMRSVFNYANLFVCSYVTFSILKSNRVKLDAFLKWTLLVWIAAGVIQLVYDRSSFSYLLPSMRTTEDRGVVGLATEPTFYGVVLIFYILILTHLETKNRNFYIALCVLAIFLLAQSSMSILFLLILSVIYLLTHMTFKRILVSVLMLILTPMLVETFLFESRVHTLVKYLLSEPENLLLLDASIHDRFFHIFFPLKGFFDWFLMPHGYSAWESFAESSLVKYSNIVMWEWFSVGGRIMSGYGSAFFELGFFGFIIPLTIGHSLRRVYKDRTRRFLFHFFAINIIMFSAIPIGFPIFAFYIGFLNYLSFTSKIK